MKPTPHQFRLRWLFRLAALLAMAALAWQPIGLGAAASAGELPPIPLYLSIDQFGRISLTSGVSMEVPRLLSRQGQGPAAAAPAPWTPSQPYNAPPAPASDAYRIVVRFDGYSYIYDLQKRPISEINFDRGYYQVTQLSRQGNVWEVQAMRTFVRNDIPNAELFNLTATKIKTGRRSCLETAFHSRMWARVSLPVRMRHEPYIPMDLDINWTGSLRSGERIFILITYCNAGSWLRLERESGTIGWAKEWGLTEELVERTFIVPDELKKK